MNKLSTHNILNHDPKKVSNRLHYQDNVLCGHLFLGFVFVYPHWEYQTLELLGSPMHKCSTGIKHGPHTSPGYLSHQSISRPHYLF